MAARETRRNAAALRQAVKWNMISRNPAEVVDRPRAPRPEIKPLDVEQCRHRTPFPPL